MKTHKVLDFKTALAVSMPKQYCVTLGISAKDLLDIFLLDSETIAIKKHHSIPNKIRQPISTSPTAAS